MKIKILAETIPFLAIKLLKVDFHKLRRTYFLTVIYMASQLALGRQNFIRVLKIPSVIRLKPIFSALMIVLLNQTFNEDIN